MANPVWTLDECVSFAKASAQSAWGMQDCYKNLQDAIDSARENIRDTLQEYHAVEHEQAAWGVFDAEMVRILEFEKVTFDTSKGWLEVQDVQDVQETVEVMDTCTNVKGEIVEIIKVGSVFELRVNGTVTHNDVNYSGVTYWYDQHSDPDYCW